MTNAGPLFRIAEDVSVDRNRYVRLEPINPEGLAEALAPRIQKAYFDLRQAEARLRTAIADLNMFSGAGIVVSEQSIEAALEEELDAVLPAEWKEGGRPQQTDVQRSELAEIIGNHVLSEFFGTNIPASRIAVKEVPDQQTRGVDVLGVEDVTPPAFSLALGEVKGSNDRRSPPGVIAGMEKKLKDLVQNRRTIVQELIWLRDNCAVEDRQLCNNITAAYMLNLVQPNFIMVPILVRTVGVAANTDAGNFRTNPAGFGHDIRFITVIIDAEDLFKFAVRVYRKARELMPR